MWKIMAVAVVILVAADMFFVDSRYLMTLGHLVSEIGKSFGIAGS